MYKPSKAFKGTTILLTLIILFALALLWRADETRAQREINSSRANKQAVQPEIFRQFDDWVARYLSNASSADAEFLQTGEKLAAERCEAFKNLIRTNPRAAIESAVAAEVRNRLPEQVANLLEKEVSARGDFNVVAIDGVDLSEVHDIEREVVINNSRFKAFVYGRRASMTTKLAAPLRGVVLDDLIAVDEHSVRKI
jgi:hypothetical protein